MILNLPKRENDNNQKHGVHSNLSSITNLGKKLMPKDTTPRSWQNFAGNLKQP